MKEEISVELQEILWTKIPDWVCVRCTYANKAARSKCRNPDCGAPRPDSVLREAKELLAK